MANTKYTAEDLQHIDSGELIRRRPEMFLGPSKVCGVSLAERMIGDLLLIQNSRVFAANQGSWWIVLSSIDWWQHFNIHCHDRLFDSLVRFPEAGQNCFHFETVILAFSTSVFSTCCGEQTCLKSQGAPSVPEEISVVPMAVEYCRSLMYELSPGIPHLAT